MFVALTFFPKMFSHGKYYFYWEREKGWSKHDTKELPEKLILRTLFKTSSMPKFSNFIYCRVKTPGSEESNMCRRKPFTPRNFVNQCLKKYFCSHKASIKAFYRKTIWIPDAIRGILFAPSRDLTISRLRNMFRECNLESTQHMAKWQNKSISIWGEELWLLCINGEDSNFFTGEL